MSNRTNTSYGQKVDLGAAAPVKREAAGYVDESSLAAESVREGGEFASNPDAVPAPTKHRYETRSAHSSHAAVETGRGTGGADPKRGSHGGTGKSSDEQGAPAPSYVTVTKIREPGGPHGKNITEGIPEGQHRDGVKKALAAEPGSQDDPSRVVEQTFRERAAGGVGVPKGGRTGLDGGYDVLDANEQA